MKDCFKMERKKVMANQSMLLRLKIKNNTIKEELYGWSIAKYHHWKTEL